ncbi:Cell division topological determinant MinJ [Listeria grayi]|uniref:Cell division topological determinant MinJ n=1 Tax=Listeria grayi TaxID=1641 RepID=A0A378MDH2_LISGR|nr:S1C family serine protease [Listeria grayi]STY44410.1 Cell division topological determinant MinJ [Listeria grayi]
MWFIPVVLFIPGSVIVGLFDWWPVLSIGSHTFALVIVPFAFGYQMEVQGEEPVQAVRRLAKHVLLLAIVVAILAGLSFVWPILTLAAALVAIIGRIVISIMQTRRDRHLPKRYTPQADGLMLLGAKAGSPAERMNLIAGDKIVEVNGKKWRIGNSFTPHLISTALSASLKYWIRSKSRGSSKRRFMKMSLMN